MLIIGCTNYVFADVSASQAEELAKKSFLGQVAKVKLEYIRADRKIEIEESFIDLQMAASKNKSPKYYYIYEVVYGGCKEINANQYQCKFPIGGTPFYRFAISKSTGQVYDITSFEYGRANDFIKELDLSLNDNNKRSRYYHSMASLSPMPEIPEVLSLYHLKCLLGGSLSWHFQLAKEQGVIADFKDKQITKWINKWITAFLSERRKVIYGTTIETKGTSYIVRKTGFTSGEVPGLWEYKIQIALDGSIEDYDNEMLFGPYTGKKDWETGKENKFKLPQADYFPLSGGGIDRTALPFPFREEIDK